MNLNPKNLQEYVVAKIIEYNNERDKEIEKLKDELKRKERSLKKAKAILREHDICFECVCDRCKRKIIEHDTSHSHNAHPDYPTLCYTCFFILL